MDYTTLQRIKDKQPCADGWALLLNSLGKTKADKIKLSFKRILDSNGLDDAIWALRTHKDGNKVRLFAADCAERVLHIFEKRYPNDTRPRLAIEAARDYALGKITLIELGAARAAARAARAAGDAAWAAAWAAEREAQEELYKKYFC